MEGTLIDHSPINFYRLLTNHALRSQGLSNSSKQGHTSPHPYIVTHIKYLKLRPHIHPVPTPQTLHRRLKAGAIKILIKCQTQMATTPIKSLSILSHASIKPYHHGEIYHGTFENWFIHAKDNLSRHFASYTPAQSSHSYTAANVHKTLKGRYI